MKKKISAIIQARIGSQRFPNKVLNKLIGKTLIEILYHRLEKSKYLSSIVFAIPDNEENILLENEIKRIGARYYKGSENDVLERYFMVAEEFQFEQIVRITADCPLTDPEMLDHMIEIYFENNYEYISNSLPPTFPDGFDIEIFSFQLLKETYLLAVDDFDREHVTSFIRRNIEKKKYNYESEINYSSIRLTVDEPQDLELLQAISEKTLNIAEITYNQAITILEEHPELKDINHKVVRN